MTPMPLPSKFLSGLRQRGQVAPIWCSFVCARLPSPWKIFKPKTRPSGLARLMFLRPFDFNFPGITGFVGHLLLLFVKAVVWWARQSEAGLFNDGNRRTDFPQPIGFFFFVKDCDERTHSHNQCTTCTNNTQYNTQTHTTHTYTQHTQYNTHAHKKTHRTHTHAHNTHTTQCPQTTHAHTLYDIICQFLTTLFQCAIYWIFGKFSTKHHRKVEITSDLSLCSGKFKYFKH